MFQPSRWLRGIALTPALVPLVAGVTFSVESPAQANPVYFGQGAYFGTGQQYPTTSIYGSPIPAPVPVNPVTGSPYSSSFYGVSPVFPRRVTGGVVNSTLINPTVINSSIYNSTLVNPTIIDYPRHTFSYPGRVRTILRKPVYFYPAFGQNRTIIRTPRYFYPAYR